MVSETELIARYSETDQMGIVHHSNYPIWFEAGRTTFFKQLGLSYSKIEEAGTILPLTSLICTFKSPARYEEEIIVRTRVLKMSVVKLVFQYEVLKKEGMLPIVIGETAHAWTNKQLKPVNLEKKLPELYFRLKEVLDISHNGGYSWESI